MGPKMLAYFHGVLLVKQAEASEGISAFRSHVVEESATLRVPDPADRGMAEAALVQQGTHANKLKKLLGEIAFAIGQIESGEYGYCIDTDDRIGVRRLMAHPWAKRTVEAQTRADKGLGPLAPSGLMVARLQHRFGD